jgi:hypothetical protein
VGGATRHLLALPVSETEVRKPCAVSSLASSSLSSITIAARGVEPLPRFWAGLCSKATPPPGRPERRRCEKRRHGQRLMGKSVPSLTGSGSTNNPSGSNCRSNSCTSLQRQVSDGHAGGSETSSALSTAKVSPKVRGVRGWVRYKICGRPGGRGARLT